MNLQSVGVFLSDQENQKVLAFVGSGLAITIGGVWQAYLHFSGKSKESTTVTPLGGSISAGGNVTVINGITLEQYETGLKHREQEVRSELSQASVADKEKIALLDKQLTDVQTKLQNPEAALESYKKKLTDAYNAFDDLKREVLPEQIKQAQEALTKGQTTDAEKLFTQVLTQGKENAAEAAYQLAQLAQSRIDYAAAYRYFKEAAYLQPDNPFYLNQAGHIAYTVGRYSEAEPLYQRSLAIREKALGKDHPDVAESLNNLAELYYSQGNKYAEAEPHYSQGKYAEAEPLYQRSLAIREKVLGKDHPDVATSLNNLAVLYDSQGKYDQAEPLYQRSLAIREKAFGKDHPYVATSLNNLAELYRTQGKYAEAEPLYQHSLAIWEKALGKDHLDVAKSLNNLAMLYQTQGKYDQAKPLYQRSLAICEKALDKDHPTTKTIRNNLQQLTTSAST